MNRLERLENLSAYIDGELAEQEHRLLVAWCENHPEDLEHFEDLAEVVRQVRGLPQVEPPAGLRDQILRAVAETEPVAATRDQAIEWLDDYLDGELSEPRRAVVDHFLAVDPEFAELAEMQVAMLAALSDMGEAEPPADLRQRIEASVKQAGAAERPSRPRRPVRPVRSRRQLAVGAAAALLLGMVLALGRNGRDSAPVVASQPPATVTPEAAPLARPGAAQVAGQPTEADPVASAVPELPADDAAEPVVPEEMAPAAPVTPRARRERVVTPSDTRNLADRQQRAPRAPAPRRTAPNRTQPRATTPSAPERKRTPSVAPAPLPLESSGGALAGDASRGSTNSGPEFIHRRGNDSVLGSDNDGGGVVEGDGSNGSRGPVDPTRRTEAPPF